MLMNSGALITKKCQMSKSIVGNIIKDACVMYGL